MGAEPASHEPVPLRRNRDFQLLWCGLVGAGWNVSVQTYRMQIPPTELLGRTSSVALQIAWGVIPLGSLLAGFLLQALSPAAAIAVVAVGMTVTAAAATAVAPVRDAGRPTPAPSGPAPGAAGTAPPARCDPRPSP